MRHTNLSGYISEILLNSSSIRGVMKSYEITILREMYVSLTCPGKIAGKLEYFEKYISHFIQVEYIIPIIQQNILNKNNF